MKHLIKITLVAAFVLGASVSAFGQKYGYINSEELITAMPDLDSVNVKLEKIVDDYRSQLEIIQVELNNKYQDYQKNSATYSEATQQSKQSELNDLSKRYNDFNQLAQTNVQQKQAELMQPVVEKANNAIKKVAQANGLIFVFDTAPQTNALAYFDETQLVNILAAVKAELGIKDKPAAQ